MALDTAKHKSILIKILKDIYTDTSIGPLLGFKGGTAAYLFYKLSRASLDLDFDLLGDTKDDYVFEKFEEIVKQYGKIKERRKKRFNLFLVFSYEDGAPNIKIEINRGEFGSRYEVKSYLGISMKVMAPEDMFARKLVAMYERIGKASRDIFDVCFFLQRDWPINKEIVEKRTTRCLSSTSCRNALMRLRNYLIGAFLPAWESFWMRNKKIGLGQSSEPRQYSS